MSINAYLPCFKCAKVLPNVFVEADNQPYGGTVFTTEGHYGSTFWDSFGGEELVLTVCDDCLKEHSDRLGQQKAYLPVFCEGVLVGRQVVDRPLVAYTGNLDDTRAHVHVEELGTEMCNIEWVPDIADIKADIERELIA